MKRAVITGATGGIGGTYAVMPELWLRSDRHGY